jgi:dihydroorotate dehydrogenase electron transfer subunit
MKYTQALYPIVKKEVLGKHTLCLDILCPDIATVAQPGQFVHILPAGHTLRRPISICNLDKEKGILTIVFESKQAGTEWIANRNVGENLDVLGPLGHGFTLKPDVQHVVLIGGGIGTPPMLPLAQYYGEKSTVICGFRNAGCVILQDAFQKTGAQTILCTDDGTAGRKALVTEPLKELLESGSIDAVYACGPTPMLKFVSAIALEADVFCEVSLEERMGCGIGACLVCACKLKKEGKDVMGHVCKDGPVFSAKEVQW